MSKVFHEEDPDEEWFEQATGIERAISAPPVMDSGDSRIPSNSIFAFQSKYSHLFGDIRYEDEYESFYKTYNDPTKLPAPLNSDFLFVGNDKKKVFPPSLIIKTNMSESTKGAKNDEILSRMNNLNFDEKPMSHEEKQPTTPSKRISNGTIGQEKRKTNSTNQKQVASPKILVESKTPQELEEIEEERVKSPILTSPRSDKEKSPRSKKYSHVSDVLGRIYSLSKDQYGCRFLQKKLEENRPEDIEAIFAEIFDHIVELMTDPFGNYLCQKLLEHVDEKQKTLVIKAVANDLVTIATNMHGTRAVQKLIECLTSPEQVRLVTNALKSSVVTLIRDLNGNHVIQRCLQKLSYSDKQFIYDAITGKCIQVSTHKHGCCVLQRSIDFASEKQKMQLVNEVIAHALQLVQDPFGNYVVQYVLDLADESITVEIIKKFLGSIDTLSTNKFSSNVIEQCIRLAPLSIRHKMIDEILGMDKLESILQDSYGNYVIQTAIGECDSKQFVRFNEVIKPMLPNIKNTPYGKKIESKLLKTVKKPGDTRQFAKKSPSTSTTKK